MTHLNYDDILEPGYYQQKPPPVLEGDARPHRYDTTESAVELAMWLAENGIQALVAPKTRNTSAILQITGSNDSAEIVWPTDWVLLQVYGDATIIPHILKQDEIVFGYKRTGA